MRRRFVIDIEDGEEGPADTYRLALDVIALLETNGYLPDECFHEEPVRAVEIDRGELLEEAHGALSLALTASHSGMSVHDLDAMHATLDRLSRAVRR